MKRLTAAGLAVALVAAVACNTGASQTLDLTITGNSTPAGRVAITRTVDAHTTADSIRVPYERHYRARQVAVQVTTTAGRVDCRIEYRGRLVAVDRDPAARSAVCTASRPDGDQ